MYHRCQAPGDPSSRPSLNVTRAATGRVGRVGTPHASRGRERSPVLACHHEMLHSHAIDMWPSDGGQGVGLSKRQPCGRAGERASCGRPEGCLEAHRPAGPAAVVLQLMETAGRRVLRAAPAANVAPTSLRGLHSLAAWLPGDVSSTLEPSIATILHPSPPAQSFPCSCPCPCPCPCPPGRGVAIESGPAGTLRSPRTLEAPRLPDPVHA